MTVILQRTACVPSAFCAVITAVPEAAPTTVPFDTDTTFGSELPHVIIAPSVFETVKVWLAPVSRTRDDWLIVIGAGRPFTVTRQDASLPLPSIVVAEMTTAPACNASRLPDWSTRTIFSSLLVQCTLLLFADTGAAFAFSFRMSPSVITIPRLLKVSLVTGCSTTTLHLSFFLPTFAVMTAVPFFFAVTFPFALTVATERFELVKRTFFFVPRTFSEAERPFSSVRFV